MPWITALKFDAVALCQALQFLDLRAQYHRIVGTVFSFIRPHGETIL